ncbi:MAG TPA: hypothetical protein VJM10_03510, partial [Candidatus Methylomirabilis sp.]|nr:hypothetical protein [Candidatus Methylomirabilis sp.]
IRAANWLPIADRGWTRLSSLIRFARTTSYLTLWRISFLVSVPNVLKEGMRELLGQKSNYRAKNSGSVTTS